MGSEERRTIQFRKRRCVMTDPAVTAKQLVDLARKHIEDQQSRIARQRELMSKYERDDDVARLSVARLVLERMRKLKFSDDLSPLVTLVLLASKMVDVTDEKAVIHILSVEAPYFLKHLEGRRKGIDGILTLPGIGCPQNSTMVADTAHKILRIYSEAATLFASIVKKIGASPPR